MGMDPRATLCFGIAYTAVDELPDGHTDAEGDDVDLRDVVDLNYPHLSLRRRGSYDHCDGAETLCADQSRMFVEWDEPLDVSAHLAKFTQEDLERWTRELNLACDKLDMPYRLPTWTMSAFYG